MEVIELEELSKKKLFMHIDFLNKMKYNNNRCIEPVAKTSVSTKTPTIAIKTKYRSLGDAYLIYHANNETIIVPEKNKPVIEKTLAEKNDDLRNQIQNKYSIKIAYKDELENYTINGYGLEK